MNIIQKPVRNYSAGRFGYKPEAIVIHIAEGYLDGAYSWFNNASSQVSSHYMVGRNGAIWQFVKDEDTAWHAGGVNNPNWSLFKPGVNPNFYTIGIEHEGFTGEKWSNEMYQATAELIAFLCAKFSIDLDRNHIIGHNQINSVSRKNCPGSGVDFSRLINQALTFYEDPKVVEELQNQIKNLTAQISDLKKTVDILNTENKSLKSTINELEAIRNTTDIEKLKSNNVKLTKEVKRLQLTESSLTKEVSNLKSEILALNKQLVENDDDLVKNLSDLFGKIFRK